MSFIIFSFLLILFYFPFKKLVDYELKEIKTYINNLRKIFFITFFLYYAEVNIFFRIVIILIYYLFILYLKNYENLILAIIGGIFYNNSIILTLVIIQIIIIHTLCSKNFKKFLRTYFIEYSLFIFTFLLKYYIL